MADFHELKNQYENIPIELQMQRRWVCFAIRTRNGESIKIPVSPVAEGVTNGALSDDESALLMSFRRLDKFDRCNVAGYINGLLASEKYIKTSAASSETA